MTERVLASKVCCMRPTSQPVTRLDYCQYLLVSRINYILTNFAEHAEQFSHAAANRDLLETRCGGTWCGRM